jgi:hypothetical protein
MTETEYEAEVGRLKAENQKLTKELSSAHDDLKEVRSEARDRRHENKQLAGQVEGLTKERDDYKVRAETDPEGLRKQLGDHAATIRVMKHDRAFAKIASALKVTDPVKFADLQKVAGYAPEGDEPDEAKITASFQEALKGRPWLLDAAPGGATNAAGAAGATGAQSGGKPGPGADRGQSISSPPSQAQGRPAGRL